MREKANQRLLEMIMPAMRELRRVMESKTASDADKLRAVSMVLNRTGYSEKQTIDIGLRPPSEWDQLTHGGAFEFDRSEIEAAVDHPVLGGGDDPDLHALAKISRDEADRDTYLQGIDDSEVVRGEVVDPTPRPTKGSRTYRGRTTSVGPIEFPATGDPRNRGTEFDPDPGGRYNPPRSQWERYETEDDG